uniref:Secreted protein n=1 Tax=Arundo donax TaxID=35708 RepID=A0A0A8YTR5_ARUDO
MHIITYILIFNSWLYNFILAHTHHALLPAQPKFEYLRQAVPTYKIHMMKIFVRSCWLHKSLCNHNEHTFAVGD